MIFSFAIRTVPSRVMLFSALWKKISELSERDNVVGVGVSGRVDVTPNENACLALELGIKSPSDWTIFLEDDAGLIDRFMENVTWWIDKHQRSDVHVYPLGCQYSRCWSEGMVAWDYPIDAFYCSVAMVVRSAMVPSLISYMRSNAHVYQGFDLMTGHWHRTVSSSNYLVTPVPCLIEHLGDDSTLIEGRPARNVVGRFGGFKGYDFSYVEAAGG